YSPQPTSIFTLSLHDALPIWGDICLLVATGDSCWWADPGVNALRNCNCSAVFNTSGAPRTDGRLSRSSSPVHLFSDHNSSLDARAGHRWRSVRGHRLREAPHDPSTCDMGGIAGSAP